tara:strand:- start:415 stop:657 length:243 start_codon:yes stop_codon:yes gene_type:complete
MTNEFWVFAIVTFLFAVSVKKYNCLDSLREWIEDYLAQITPCEIQEQEDIVALEEIRDMIEDYVIRNPEIFSELHNKKDE